jgi:Cytosol aminopeptidase family, N-terminal domain
MRKFTFTILALLAFTFGTTQAADDVKEKAIAAPNKLTLKVRMEGPYTADTPLQVVCYFKYTPEGVKRMSGAPVELDKHLGGVIGSLRERGEFVGDDLETLLITPPEGSIKAKALLLIGLGGEATLSLEKMERVGKVVVREAVRLGVNKVAFAPLIRDQGNSKFGTGDVGNAVLRGGLLAYDTEKRLQKEGFAKAFTLDEWEMEAGQMFFDDTVAGAQKAVTEAEAAIAARSTKTYSTIKK